jgi:hypothetical protein
MKVLLLRRVLSAEAGSFGPVFWAAQEVPPGFEQASDINGVLTLKSVDDQTRSDIALLQNSSFAPCSGNKCEYCLGGCQVHAALSPPFLPRFDDVAFAYCILRTGNLLLMYRDLRMSARTTSDHLPTLNRAFSHCSNSHCSMQCTRLLRRRAPLPQQAQDAAAARKSHIMV